MVRWTDLVPHLTGTAHLATVSADGQPHVAKVAPAVDGDVVWIATRASSKKARNVAETGRAAIMWEPRAEVYVAAAVDVVDDLATRRRIWDSGLFAFPLATFFGTADDDDFVLLRLTPRSATLLSQDASGLRRDTWRAGRPV
jgi:general stress protein 26